MTIHDPGARTPADLPPGPDEKDQQGRRGARVQQDEQGRQGQQADRFAMLLAAAREIADRAYAPYSRFRVGAAALTTDGRLVRGCNVENAAYGATLCAECGLISELVGGGGGRLSRFVCVGGDEQLTGTEREVVMPCGRCRQLLSEHAADDLVILTPQGPRTMRQILPQAFGPADLHR